jgi:hypothetical protein
MRPVALTRGWREPGLETRPHLPDAPLRQARGGFRIGDDHLDGVVPRAPAAYHLSNLWGPNAP